MRNRMSSRARMPAFAGSLMAVLALLGLGESAQGKVVAPSGGIDPPSICNAIAGNLVANCGFETGNFSGWTTTAAAAGSLFGVDGNPNSGTFAAYFGAVTPPFEDMISQSIPTIAGHAYSISFFLDNAGGSPNQFTAMFDGTTLLSLTNSAPFPYTEFTDTVIATGSSTTLSFAAYQVPSFFYLDDVSVLSVAVPEPASLVLLGGALLAFGVTRRQRRAV